MGRLRDLIFRVLRGGTPDPGGGAAVPAPDEPLAIIGDVHGRADLLDRLMRKLDRKAGTARRVLVGDYIDRGPDSRTVLQRLRGAGDTVVCLRGNHEAMMLEFLDRPTEAGGRWLRNGGGATLASFGISLAEDASLADVEAAAHSLRRGLGADGEAWLRGLPLVWQSGNIVVAHAGADPGLPIPDQDAENHLWGHSRFLRDLRQDGVIVAHGHWIMPKAGFANGRIWVDTGAWRTGRLSAALVTPAGDVSFVTT